MKKNIFILVVDDEHTFEYELKLKVESLRKSVGDDTQALVGLHEAGHVITSIYATNICPSVAVSKTLDIGGYTQIETPTFETKEYLESSLVCVLGGHAAEKLIFGEDKLTNGSVSDINTATTVALAIFKEYGMKKSPVVYSTPDFRITDSAIDDIGIDIEVEQLIDYSLDSATRILKDNKTLLVKMGRYLTTHSRINSDQIKRMVKKYGTYKTPKYKTKGNFYNFKEILNNTKIDDK